MKEIRNTQGASAEADRALASGEAPVGSSSLQDGDPSRIEGMAGVLIFSKKLQEFWLAPGEGTTPLSREAHVYDMEDAKSRLCGVWDRYELRSVDGAQAIEARQGGDAEGGSVEDKSAVAAGDVPVSKSEVRSPSSTPGEVERLVDELICAVQNHAWFGHHNFGEQAVAEAMTCRQAARTALLSHISTAGRGEGAGDLAALSKKATQGKWTTGGIFDPQGARPTMCMWGPRAGGDQSGQLLARSITVADAGFVVALVNAYRSGCLVERSTADATNPQDQE